MWAYSVLLTGIDGTMLSRYSYNQRIPATFKESLVATQSEDCAALEVCSRSAQVVSADPDQRRTIASCGTDKHLRAFGASLASSEDSTSDPSRSLPCGSGGR